MENQDPNLSASANGVMEDIPWHDVLEFFSLLVNCRMKDMLSEFDLPVWADYKSNSLLRVRLRPLTSKEKQEYLSFYRMKRSTWPVLACSVVLCHADATGEMSLDAISSAREWLLRCLRLLKPGFLWMTYRPLYYVFDEVVFQRVRIPSVELRRPDIENLRQLMACIRRTGLGLHERGILSHKWIRITALGMKERQKSRSLYREVALSAFERANENGPLYVDCLVDLIVALEALHLQENDELSYRLANRVASLLGQSPKRRGEIQDEVRSFYRDRNYLIHGAAKVLSHKYDVGRLREHVRRSLLYHIALEGLGKESIIQQLDRSLFRTSVNQRLREMCHRFYGSKLAVALRL